MDKASSIVLEFVFLWKMGVVCELRYLTECYIVFAMDKMKSKRQINCVFPILEQFTGWWNLEFIENMRLNESIKLYNIY